MRDIGPYSNYRLTVRLELANKPGIFARVAALLAEEQANLGAVDLVSATKTRSALFGNAWMQTSDGVWHDMTKARFTADSNPVLNINAKRDGERFLLGTGGEIENTDLKLKETAERPEPKAKEPDVPPIQ